MTVFWWVRHGPTHQSAFTGWRDVPADLSDEAALARLDAYLPRDAALISSDLARARSTADAISAGRRRLLDDAALREFDFGAWDGLRFDEVAARDPDLSRAYWETPGDVCPPGGESWNAAAARVAAAADRLAAAGHAHLIVVAHFGVILTALARAQGLAPAAAIAQQIEPLSVTRIAGREAGPINHRP